MRLSLVSDILDASAVNEMARVWLEYDAAPRVIVDEDLRIAWANTAARSALARARDLENRGGFLRTIDRGQQEALDAFVAGSGVGVSSWCLPRADRDGHVLFRAQRLAWEQAPVFGVLFYGSGSDFRSRYVDLERVFGLTPAEHRVLLDMLDGFEADRIAEGSGVSIETVRTHIRRIYAKVGVRSRERLFSRMRPYRIN